MELLATASGETTVSLRNNNVVVRKMVALHSANGFDKTRAGAALRSELGSLGGLGQYTNYYL